MSERFLDEVMQHGPRHGLQRMAGVQQLAVRSERNEMRGEFGESPEVLLNDPMKVHCS